jgi:hypothetical protein
MTSDSGGEHPADSVSDTYSSTHRFPDERTPIEATPLSATSVELGLGFGLGFGIGFTGTLLLARAPLLLATLLLHTIPFPAFTSVWWSDSG